MAPTTQPLGLFPKPLPKHMEMKASAIKAGEPAAQTLAVARKLGQCPLRTSTLQRFDQHGVGLQQTMVHQPVELVRAFLR